MSFRQRFASLFSAFWRRPDPPGTVAPVDPSEPLTRFIFTRAHYSPEHKRVKPDAFLPDPRFTPLATSMYRTRDLDADRLWVLGREVGAAGGRGLKARGDVTAAAACAGDKLSLDATVRVAIAPDRHVDLRGWPEQADARRMLALEIAREARLVIPS